MTYIDDHGTLVYGQRLHNLGESMSFHTLLILSQFDVLCIVKDTADHEQDKLLVHFVISGYLRSHPKFDTEHNKMDVGTTLGQ